MTEAQKLIPAPKLLLLLPTHSQEAPPVYGVMPFSTKEEVKTFFDEMRQHLQLVVDIVQTKTVVGGPIHDGTYYAFPSYDELVKTRHDVSFLKVQEDVDEEKIRGVENLEALFMLTAEDLLRPNVDVVSSLDVENGIDTGPVILDFAAWHLNCTIGGHFTGTVDEFWAEISKHFVRIELDRTIIRFPISLDVVRAGPTPVFKDFKNKVRVEFISTVKHSDDEEFRTEELSLPTFIGVCEDVLSRL